MSKLFISQLVAVVQRLAFLECVVTEAEAPAVLSDVDGLSRIVSRLSAVKV